MIKKLLKCLTAAVTSAAVLGQMCGASADIYGYAVPETDNERGMGYIDMGYRAPSADGNKDNERGLYTSSQIPESYSSVAKGYVTSVKRQGSLGTCWAFAATASMESYLLTHGYADNAEDVDLSEYALASLTFDDRSYTDTAGTASEDYTYTSDMYDSMITGGNDNYVFKTLSKWAGIMEESDVPYDYTGETVVSYDSSMVKYILTGQYFINMSDMEHVKKAVMENGAVSTYYNANDEYSVSAPGYPEYYHYTYKETYTNHAVAIVGWDDTVSRENFTIDGTYTPENDGAWLIKNSWGTYYGDNGYMWISYEDQTILKATACVYEITPKTEYDYNYQHDGADLFGYSVTYNASAYANVYNVSGENSQDILAVAFAVEDADRDYSITLFRNPEEDSPESGTPLLTEAVEGSTLYAGYYTVKLPQAVTVYPGDTFSVVIKFDRSTAVTSAVNGSYDMGGGYAYAVNTNGDNHSYVINENGVYDIYEISGQNVQADLCIKAFASDHSEDSCNASIISISNSDNAGLKISWQRGASVTYCELLRADSEDGEYTVIYTGTDSSYTDITAVINNDYYYKVRAYDEDGNPYDSAVKKGRLELETASIRNVSYDDSGITIEWNAVSGISGYKIYRSTDKITYSEVADVQDALEYTDNSVKYNTKYYYMIKTYAEREGYPVELSAAGVVSEAVKKVSSPVSFRAGGDTLNVSALSWQAGGKATGYTIYRCYVNSEDSYIKDEKIADVSADTLEYTADISSVKQGSSVEFYVRSYITEDGIRKYSNSVLSVVYVKYKPVSNIKWYVSGGYIYVKWDSYESDMTVSEYVLYGYDNLTDTVMSAVKVSEDTATVIRGYDAASIHYVTVQAKNAMYNTFTYAQSPRVGIGGVMNGITLQNIQDVQCDKGEKVTLEAKITDELENFDYTFQWYKTDSDKTAGTAVSGADEKTFLPDTSAYGTARYYCVVSGIYNGTVTGSTNVVAVTIPDPDKDTGTDEDKDKDTIKVPEYITSNVVAVNNTSNVISRITVGTTVSELLNAMDCKEYTAVYAGTVKQSGGTAAATGMTVVIEYGGKIIRSYTIIVTGDTNGDGKINVADMMSVKSHILKKSGLKDNALKAADVNGDGKVNVADFMSIKGYILKKNGINGVAVK